MQSPLFESYSPIAIKHENNESFHSDYEDDDQEAAGCGGTTTSLDEIVHSDEERVVLDYQGRPMQPQLSNRQRFVVKTELSHYPMSEASGQMRAYIKHEPRGDGIN
jgi:hypothetical protein